MEQNQTRLRATGQPARVDAIMDDRTPPHDFQAERGALYRCLTLGKIPETLAELKPHDFYEPAHETIWATMLWLLTQSRACDANAVLARLQETKRTPIIQLLPDILTGQWPASDDNLARIILDRSGRRQVIKATTTTLQRAYDSEDDYETILQKAEAELAQIPARDSGTVDTLQTLDEFLGETIPDPEWVIDGLLARDERAIITGLEGLGKTTLIRQLGICAAAGIDPFTGRRTEARTVLAIDAENPRHIMQKRYSELRQAVNAHGAPIAEGRFWLDNRPAGLDLNDPADRRWLQRRVKIVRPDLLVIGPAYKLHTSGNDDKDETIARTVTTVLDHIRTDASCALILEHHAGNEQAGGQRPVRPFGSSLWRRWPEFGYGIRPAKPPQYMTAAESDRRRIVDLVPWRGARDVRHWPHQMESGGAGLPWISYEEVA